MTPIDLINGILTAFIQVALVGLTLVFPDLRDALLTAG